MAIKKYPMYGKCTKWPKNISTSSAARPGRPKFTQIGIFGLKIAYHLATLAHSETAIKMKGSNGAC
jgi:hypothetical protein